MADVALAGIPLWTVVLIGLIVLAGGFVQATVGLGLGMLGAPLIALIEPRLVPTMLLMLAIPVSAAVLVAERRHIDWRVVGWALPARVPGTFLGVWLVTVFSDRGLAVVIAVVVLVGVLLASRTVALPQTPAALVGAGFASATAGTAAAIGGPPMAIVMAHRPASETRATLSLFFVAGSLLSVVVFAAQDAIPRASFLLGLAYLPLLAIAFPLGTWASRSLPREAFRRGVLLLCALSACLLLVKSVLG